MNSWIKLPLQERLQYLQVCAERQGLLPIVIEKDWWVTATLYVLHQLPYHPYLLFKGGTSLSKAHHLISRFSEDIDIAISCEYFGKEYTSCKRTTVETLKKKCTTFVSQQLREDLAQEFKALGIDQGVLFEISPEGEDANRYPDPRRLTIYYPSVLKPGKYLQDHIILEVGVRSRFKPFERTSVQSLLLETFPSFQDKLGSIELQVASAAKTFIEKVYLLHEIFASSYQPQLQTNRKSRHLYDLYCMIQQGILLQALGEEELWLDIARHRALWTPYKKLDYKSIKDRLQILPTHLYDPDWRRDYEELRVHFIFSPDPPTYEELLELLRDAESQIRATLNKANWDSW